LGVGTWVRSGSSSGGGGKRENISHNCPWSSPSSFFLSPSLPPSSLTLALTWHLKHINLPLACLRQIGMITPNPRRDDQLEFLGFGKTGSSHVSLTQEEEGHGRRRRRRKEEGGGGGRG